VAHDAADRRAQPVGRARRERRLGARLARLARRRRRRSLWRRTTASSSAVDAGSGGRTGGGGGILRRAGAPPARLIFLRFFEARPGTSVCARSLAAPQPDAVYEQFATWKAMGAGHQPGAPEPVAPSKRTSWRATGARRRQMGAAHPSVAPRTTMSSKVACAGNLPVSPFKSMP